MLRLLPYLLILLVFLFFSKLLNIIENYMSILDIQESSAQLNKPQPDTKNKTPDLTKNDKISKISEGEDINRINSQSLLQENFQLESEKKLLQELRKRRKEIEGYREELLTDKGALDSVKQYIDNRLKLLKNVQYKLKPYLHESL